MQGIDPARRERLLEDLKAVTREIWAEREEMRRALAQAH